MQAERQRCWYQNLTPEQRKARRIRQRSGFDHSQTMSPEARRTRAVKARAAHRSDCHCGPCLTARGEIDYATLRQWGYEGGVARHRKWLRDHSSRTPQGRAWRQEQWSVIEAQLREAIQEPQKEQRDSKQVVPPEQTIKIRIRFGMPPANRGDAAMADQGA
jgi:hypothetical protein